LQVEGMFDNGQYSYSSFEILFFFFVPPPQMCTQAPSDFAINPSPTKLNMKLFFPKRFMAPSYTKKKKKKIIFF